MRKYNLSLKKKASPEKNYGGLPELAISTPIVSKNRGKLIGVLANYILISELDKIMTGEYNKEIGAISWNKGRY